MHLPSNHLLTHTTTTYTTPVHFSAWWSCLAGFGFQKNLASIQVTGRQRGGLAQLKRWPEVSTAADVFLRACTSWRHSPERLESQWAISPHSPGPLRLNRGIGCPGSMCFCLGKPKPYDKHDTSHQSTDLNGRYGKGFYNKLNWGSSPHEFLDSTHILMTFPTIQSPRGDHPLLSFRCGWEVWEALVWDNNMSVSSLNSEKAELTQHKAFGSPFIPLSPLFCTEKCSNCEPPTR